ncbi:MAG: transglycosylase domain-containing protein [Spirochaetales bacterium]|nr:transglycosylase domain-containing protein [Spirochaetales bacterium]
MASRFLKLSRWFFLHMLVCLSAWQFFQFLNPPLLLKKEEKRLLVYGGELYLAKEVNIEYPLAELPTALVQALLFQEDQAFYEHRGYHLREMGLALVDFASGSRLRGASTITQQLARTLFLSREKTLQRKLQELYLARLLELHLSKQEILELYLNHVYWGKNQSGIGRAARYYFASPPARLSLSQIAFLISLLPHPDQCKQKTCPAPLREKRQRRLERYLRSL